MKKFLCSTAKNIPIPVPITVTNNAWKKIEEILYKTENKNSFIFSATSGGCNGFNYNLQLVNHEKVNDIDNNSKIKPTIIEKNKAKIIIDPLSEMHLLGTTIDYVFEDYDKGDFENKFTFTPDKNYATSCGCGISFNPK